LRYLRYLGLIAILMVPLASSEARVRVGVGFGLDYITGPPVCAYGYYSYYPYACAPYGYYGPDWFAGGEFIGAGPWFGWGPGWSGWGRGFDRRFDGRRFGRDFDRRGFDRHFDGRGFRRGGVRGFRGGSMGGFHSGRGFGGGGGDFMVVVVVDKR
jgi:hypothetical protein